MDSPPHHCSYDLYDSCQHKVNNCHHNVRIPTESQHLSAWSPGLCPDCQAKERSAEMRRFGVCVG